MRTDLLVSIRAFILVVIGQLSQSAGADYQQGTYEYYNNHGNANSETNNNYNYYSNYDVGKESNPVPDDSQDLPKSIACFSCTLVKHAGHVQGMTNCDDPFIRMDIPTVDCKGPCGKLYHQHGENDFVITRGCIPNCKEHRDEKMYTQCCTKGYCNKSSSLHHQHHIMWLLSSIFLTLWFLRR